MKTILPLTMLVGQGSLGCFSSMKANHLVFLFLLFGGLSGCQITYYLKSAYHQAKILNARRPIEKVLVDPKIDSETKRKLKLALKAREFAEEVLGLKPTSNYTSYSDIGRPYVSWILHAAPAFELKHHLWWFPLVGHLPYKGFFSIEEAQEEAKHFPSEKFDTYIRGVTAYSTLGWFEDPILNTMIAYSDHHLVNLIIHETLHSTLYIKSNADFNEQLATFIGNKGTQLFYLNQEGDKSPTLDLIKKEAEDEKLFSEFITRELDLLDQWYRDQKNPTPSLESKELRLNEINSRFAKEILPLFKVHNYTAFANQKLNNAQLLSLKTYVYDLSKFEQAFASLGGDFKKFILFCKSLEKSKDPSNELEKIGPS